jgi:ABC-type polysaccharide/polyol phosphate export permease
MRSIFSGTVVKARHRRAFLGLFWLIFAVGLISIALGVLVALRARALHASPLYAVAAILVLFGIARILNALRHIRLFAARSRPGA